MKLKDFNWLDLYPDAASSTAKLRCAQICKIAEFLETQGLDINDDDIFKNVTEKHVDDFIMVMVMIQVYINILINYTT